MNLTSILPVSLPIIQAPMAGVQGSALAIAVSEAGGLGSLPCALLNAEALRAELLRIREKTSKPVNLNFFCHHSPMPDAKREARWLEALSPYYAELGIDRAAANPGAGRRPFDEEAAALIEEFRPAVVSFHFGLPDSGLLACVKASGAKVLSSATTLAEARWLEERGVDAIIAQGVEAGEHRGMFLTSDPASQLGTFALVKEILREIRRPVIAAGGIADRRGVEAALALGAAGVQVGTAYLLCPEATTSPVHRAALRSPAARPTALTNLFSGRLARGLMNRLMEELGPISSLPPDFPLASAALAPLREKAEAEGRGDFSPLWSGTNRDGCREIPAAELTRELAGGIPR